MTKKCNVCECPDDDHYDWCTPQARAAQPSSKEIGTRLEWRKREPDDDGCRWSLVLVGDHGEELWAVLSSPTPLEVRSPDGPAQPLATLSTPRSALWRHMHDEHGLTLLESELDEIELLAKACSADEPLPAPTKNPMECEHATATFQCNDCGVDIRNAHRAEKPPGSVLVPGAQLDHLGWICSVCHGWNPKGPVVCRHAHSGSTSTKEVKP